PPALRGSAVQRSVCASRIATVRLPIDRGPLSSYAWATSPSSAFSPRRARRRRCPITSRTRVRWILVRWQQSASSGLLSGADVRARDRSIDAFETRLACDLDVDAFEPRV